MKYRSIKTYGNDVGLSAVFRQHKATHSHCSLLHGYSLGFRFTFGCDKLDDRNWCFDFGACDPIKQFLRETFDHKLVVAEDDPMFDVIDQLDDSVADVVVLPAVGCEMFAKYVYDHISEQVERGTDGRVKLLSVECFEHGANSAIYTG